MSEIPGLYDLTRALDAIAESKEELEVLKARARELWVQVGIELGALKPGAAELLRSQEGAK